MSLLLVAMLAGIQATTPLAATTASAPAEIETLVDNWDMENTTCGHHKAADSSETDDVEYHVVNNQSDVPLSRIELLGRHRDGHDDCDDSATGPIGWMAQVLTDGTVVFSAQTPEDMIERGQSRSGFMLHRRRGGDCCHRHHGYGPGTTIRDDDDGRDDCSCNNVAVAPASWSQAKVLYK